MTVRESRLVLTIDSRPAEQQVRDMARGLAELERHGLGAQAGAQQVDKALRGAGDSASTAAASIRRLVTGAIAGFSAMRIVDLADSWGQYASRIRMATKDAGEYETVQRRMAQSARDTYRSIEETREGFIRMSPTLRSMGLSLEQSMDAIDAFSGLLVVNAASADRGASAMDALSKSLQRGKVDQQAWTTIASTMPSVIDLIGKTTNRTAEEVRKLGVDGKITVEDMSRTLVEMADVVRKQVADMPTTVADALGNLRNSFTEYIGWANEGYGATAGLAAGIDVLGENFETIASVVGGSAVAGLSLYTLGLGKAAVESVNSARAASLAAREKAVAAAAADASASASLREAQATHASTAADLAKIAGLRGITETRAQAIAVEAAHARSTQALAAADAQATAARTALNAATAANVTMAGRLLALVGGPVGLAMTGLSVAVGAGAMAFANASREAAELDRVLKGLLQPLDDVIARFRTMNADARAGEMVRAEKAHEKAIRDVAEAYGELETRAQRVMIRAGAGAGEIAEFSAKLGDAKSRGESLLPVLEELQRNYQPPKAAAQEIMVLNSAYATATSTLQSSATAVVALSNEMSRMGHEAVQAAGGVSTLNEALIKTNEAGAKYLEQMGQRALLAGATTETERLNRQIEAGILVFEDGGVEARKHAAAIDAVGKSAGSAKSALDGLSLSAFGNALAIESSKIESALKELDIVWNRGDMGADRYFARRIAMAEAAGAAQEKALTQEIAALNTLSTRGKAGQQVREKLADAETKLAVARAKSSSELAALRAEEEAYFRGPSLENIKVLTEQSFALRDQNLALEEQVKFFGLAGSEIEKLRVARLNEQIAQQNAALATAIANGAKETEIERIRDLIAALYNLRNAREVSAGLQGRQEALQKEKERIEASVQSWGRGIDKIGELFVEGFSSSLDKNGDAWKAFTDNAGKALKNSVATALYEATVKPIVIRFVAEMAGMMGGAGVQAGILKAAGMDGMSNDVASLANSASKLNSIYGTVSQAFTGASVGASAASLGYANIVGAVGGDALGALIAANGGWAAAGTSAAAASGAAASGAAAAAGSSAAAAGSAATAAGAMSTAMAGIAAAAPYLAAALAVYSMLAGSFAGETRVGAQYGLASNDELYNPRRGTTVSSANGIQFLEGPSGGGDNEAVRNAIQLTTDGINSLFETIGADISLAAFWAGFEGSEKGRGGVGAGGALSSGVMFGEQGTGDNYRGTLFDPNRPGSMSAEEALQMLPAQLAQASLQAWQSAAELMPPALARVLQGYDLSAMGDDALLGLRDQFVSVVAQAEMLRIAMGELPFAPLVAQTFAFAAALADAAGGAENAANLLAGYYTNYYSEAERAAHLTEQLTGRFAELGLTLPQTRDEMRGLVEANLALGEAGAKTAAELLGMQESLATILAAQEQAYQAVLQERMGLEGQLLQLMGDTAELRRRELERLDPSNRALQELIWARQAEQEAMAAVATAIEAATRAAEDMVEATWQLAVSAVSDAMSAVTRAVQAERDAAQTAHSAAMSTYQTQLQAAQRAASELSSVYNTLGGALRSMRLESDAYEQMRRVEAQAQISAALAIARAGGSLRNLDLGDALSAVQQNSTSMFSTWEDYALDWARTANEVGALQDIAGKQLSVEERAVSMLERQMEMAGRQHEAEMARLQAIVDQAQAQVDAALGIDTSVMTVQQAVMALAQSIGKLAATPRPPTPTPQTSGSVVDGWYSDILGRQADSGGAAYWESEIRRIGESKALADFLYAARGVGELASFAVGTNYVPNDMVAQIHQGERIIPAADNALLMERLSSPAQSQAVLVAEIQRLGEKLDRAERRLQAIETNTRDLNERDDEVSEGARAVRVVIVENLTKEPA